MLKISHAVENIVNNSVIMQEAMRLGIVNFRALAEIIHQEVEVKTVKPVKKESIVVALARLAHKKSKMPPLVPNFVLDEVSIKSPLCTITFEKTSEMLLLARNLSAQVPTNASHFLTITEGIHELTIIASASLEEMILAYFTVAPKAVFRQLVGVSVQFGEAYLLQPNVLYAIISVLATRRINLVEIVSTYTQLTLVIEEKEMPTAVSALNDYFISKIS